MAHTTLLGWANSIRMTMANDPGRKLFQEQIQTHGFSFLDDYLENILSGAKQDTLIELVKTPGRKKAVSRKSKFTSKQGQVVSVSLKDRGGDGTTENFPSENSLTQAFLDVKGFHIDPPSKGLSQLASQPTRGSLHSQNQGMPNQSCGMTSLAPPELSVIPEDDEVLERSRLSIQTPRSPVYRHEGEHNITTTTLTEAVTQKPDPSTHSETLHATPHELESFEDEPHIGRVYPHGFKHVGEHPVLDITVPIRDFDFGPSSPLASTRKSVLSTLPTLPEPMPLRKSMRAAKELSVSNAMLGTATPVNPGGKRTSWLMKAREANALEAIQKKLSTNHFFTTSGFSGMKRKSEEMVDVTQASKEERQSKVAKQGSDEIAPIKATSSAATEPQSVVAEDLVARSDREEMLDMLKKKVQGLEARNDRQSNKASGDAAAALAQARAQAEARIAERNHKEEELIIHAAAVPGDEVVQSQPPTRTSGENERQWSAIDLFPAKGKVSDKSKAPTEAFVFTSPKSQPMNHVASNNESTSTTPPHSPPAQVPVFTVKSPPVFDKPPPVFIPPVPNIRPLPTPPVLKESSFPLPPLSAFSKPISPKLGLLPDLSSSPSSNKVNAALPSFQSAVKTVQSDEIFGDRGNTEAWVPSTEGVEYSSALGSHQAVLDQPNVLDDDDSWPIDEKLSHGVQWPFGGQSKEDSMTWSTSPSQSQRAETDGVSKGIQDHGDYEVQQISKGVRVGSLDENMDIEHDDYNTGTDIIAKDPELEELIVGRAKSPATSVESGDGHGQTSLASSMSSQSQINLFGHASKLLSSALGASKRGKPEIKKVMQMAAVAAKKQQQEDDKKAARLREMESRRQLAMQRKTEEEKSRQEEQERKTKEETERRKREREEQVEKKPVKGIAPSGSFKKEEEAIKKRKVEQDKPEKKLDPKKPPPLNKTGLKLTSSKQAGALSSSAAYNSSLSQSVTLSTIKGSEKPSKVPSAIPTKNKPKPVQKAATRTEEDHAQPSQILQTQMAARAKTAMRTETRVPSESIELPEVNSEYSDSEDEDRPRTFNPPEWAQSPELRQALEAQSTINPDDIFGAIRPLRMEEIFKARTSRFRARTSSANWSGSDRLTVEEEQEYARRMGFK